jgi:hypothetical protein
MSWDANGRPPSEANLTTGFRIRHKYNKGYYRQGPDGRPIFGDMAHGAIYATVPDGAQRVYDELSRKIAYQGKLEIVPI